MAFYKDGVEYTTVTNEDWIALEDFMNRKRLSFAEVFLVARVPYARGISARDRARLRGDTDMQKRDWQAIQDAAVHTQKAIERARG
jgi:hypothetical protein